MPTPVNHWLYNINEMEVLLWFVAIVLGILLLKFLFSFIMQIIALGIGLAMTSCVLCMILVFLDIIVWDTCWKIVQWSYWIGTAVGVLLFIKNPIETIKNAFEFMSDDSPKASQSASEKESFSFYDENNRHVTVEKSSNNNESDYRDSTDSTIQYEKIPGKNKFVKKY